MTKCVDCGKKINSAFTRCWQCNRAYIDRQERQRYDNMTPNERQDEIDAYYNRECVMCGKEGADFRKDGKCYCSTCWTIWNS